MRLLNLFFVACVGLALMQAAAKLAALLVIVAGFATFAARPKETIGCATLFIVLGLLGQYPLPTLAASAVLLLLVQVAQRKSRD